MTSLTMISTKSLIIVVLLAIYIQNIACKNVEGGGIENDPPAKPYPLATRQRDLRGLREIWNQVKRSAVFSWNFLKKVAENTRNQIRGLANSARDYAIKTEKTFEKQLRDLQTKLRDIITDLHGTGKLVQQCLKIEGEHIQDALRDVLHKMTDCVSKEIEPLTHINGKHAELNMNDTLFMTELDNKLNACEDDKAHYEECLYMVRELVYDDIKELDDHIQKTNLESRSLVDDIRNTLTSCFLQNLVEASSYFTTEMMRVVICVMESKGHNDAIVE